MEKHGPLLKKNKTKSSLFGGSVITMLAISSLDIFSLKAICIYRPCRQEVTILLRHNHEEKFLMLS